MHAHRCRRRERVGLLLALLFPALMALAAPAARAQSYLDPAPAELIGGWSQNFSPLAEGGFYFSTFNTQNAPSSAAIWAVNLPQTGQYQVYVSSVPTIDVPRTANATYEITTALTTATVTGVNQDFSGERLLGTFTMSAGTNAIRLTDYTGEPTFSHTVVANAARWVLVSAATGITGYLDFYGHSINSAPPGTSVQIVGGNFGTTAGAVYFAGFKAPIVRWTPTDIRVLTPFTGSYPTVGPVTVVPPGGATITGPDFSIDPNAPSPTPAPQVPPVPVPPVPVVTGPTITGYAATNPRGAPINSAPAGAPVLIEGSNFGTSGSVTVSGIPAITTSWSPNEIQFTVPAASSYPFVGPVTVSSNGQTGSGPPFTITGAAPLPPVTGDWPTLLHDARQTGHADSGLDPRSLPLPWNAPLGGHPGISPVVLGGVAYIGTDTGIFAVDLASHSIRWSRSLGAAARSAAAATAQAVVVSAGGLWGLSPIDGSTLWQRPDIVANNDVSPTLVNGIVYIGALGAANSGAAEFAIDPATGANVGVWPIRLPAGLAARGTAAASLDLGLLFVPMGPPPAAVGPGVGPLVVVAIHLPDGSPAWATPAQFPTSPPVAGLSVGYTGSGAQPGPGGVLPDLIQEAVFVASGPSVTALSASTGAPIWSRTLPGETALQGPPVLSTAASGPSTLFVAGGTGRVYALNSLTGQDATGGLASPVGAITGMLALAGNDLYVPTTSGLIAVDVSSGTLIWSYPIAVSTGVAISGGAPYVATTDGQFVGFH